MKTGFAALVLCCLTACGSAGEAEQDPGSLQSELAEFLDAYQNAVETRDLDALGNLYADAGQFEWIEDGAVRYRSADDILAALSDFPQDMPIRTEYSDRSIVPVGDAGASISTQFVTEIGTGPDAFEFSGMISIVLEKGPAGWRIVSGHTSSARETAWR